MNRFLITLLLLSATQIALGQNSAQDTMATMTQIDSSALYGFIKERPIKVGGQMESGPTKEKEYLQSLRDAQNKPIKFERLGSCCEYPSKNALFGNALLDMYEIRYLDQSNKKQKAIIYLSFYDYEMPKTIKGFTLSE